MIGEHYFNYQRGEFVHWESKVQTFNYKPKCNYHSIFVETTDSIKFTDLITNMNSFRNHLFITGETGVGKTCIIQNSIRSLTDRVNSEFTCIPLNFSAQTSSQNLQKNLESKLEKKQGKKLLCGKDQKKLILFIDDINMPEPTKFASHPPIELLRQYLDYSGIYDRPKYYWKEIFDMNLVVCGAPPIGGRSALTDRFNRHFTNICLPEPSRQVLSYIFEEIIKGFFSLEKFNDEVKKCTIEAINSTIELFEFVQTNMRPIPTKFHYIYNIRDISRVFQGILMSNYRVIQTRAQFIMLWMHENIRVFGDRLINEDDHNLLNGKIIELTDTKFRFKDFDKKLVKEDKLIFCDFNKRYNIPTKYNPILDNNTTLLPEFPYEQIIDFVALKKKLTTFTDDYNRVNKNSTMNLVFFDYALFHICRIARALRQPRGNVLVIGPGGSGKQTLTKFGALLTENDVRSFVPSGDYKQSQFRKDIKSCVIDAGSKRMRIALMLTDNNVSYK